MTPLIGLVMCGGRSSRMGSDKSHLTYNQKPQYLHVYDLISPFCEKTFISCRADQVSQFPEIKNILCDAKEYQDIGPMAALLTAFYQHPHTSFFLLGCDYPFLASDDINQLVSSREKGIEAVCFMNSEGFDEPLIAIYESGILSRLQNEFENSHYSLRHLLSELSVKRIRVVDEGRIRNVNGGSRG